MNNISYYEQISNSNKSYNIDDDFEDHIINDRDDLFSGNHVVLVTDSNPWYINKTNTVPVKYIANEFTSSSDPYERNTYQKFAKYKSKLKYDPTKLDLGFGHSFIEHKYVSTVEDFDGSSDRMNRNILISILAVLLVVFIYNKVHY